MRKLSLILGLIFIFTATIVRAESQDACAIWLCLPGGFPQGCGGAYSEFKHRIKKRKPPLPALSSCTVDGSTGGHYELGYEIWQPCKEDYVLREYYQSGSYRPNQANCYLNTCAPPVEVRNEDQLCENYAAIRRPKPSYVKMWVNGDYLGQFFY